MMEVSLTGFKAIIKTQAPSALTRTGLYFTRWAILELLVRGPSALRRLLLGSLIASGWLLHRLRLFLYLLDLAEAFPHCQLGIGYGVRNRFTLRDPIAAAEHPGGIFDDVTHGCFVLRVRGYAASTLERW